MRRDLAARTGWIGGILALAPLAYWLASMALERWLPHGGVRDAWFTLQAILIAHGGWLVFVAAGAVGGVLAFTIGLLRRRYLLVALGFIGVTTAALLYTLISGLKSTGV